MIIRNKIIPFPGYKMINICGIIFVRSKLVTDIDLNHEEIHSRQIFEMLIVFFYLWYIIEWLIRLVMYLDTNKAYKSISFEREAYAKQDDLNYLKKRKLFTWIKFLKR